jgi:hypothetical protein
MEILTDTPITTAEAFIKFIVDNTAIQLRNSPDFKANVDTTNMAYIVLYSDDYQNIALGYYCDLVNSLGHDFNLATKYKLDGSEIERELTELAITLVYNELKVK